MTKRKAWLLIVIGLALAASGCAPFMSALAKVSRGAQYIAALIDAADAGQNVYFAKHPSAEREASVRDRMKQARLAVVALESVLDAGEAASDGDIAKVRTSALNAFGDLRDLLDELGVLDARPPDGGAETDAPNPEPFELPTVADLLGG